MARKKIQYTETDLHLYSVLWNLRHAHDLFSVKLERETKFAKHFLFFLALMSARLMARLILLTLLLKQEFAKP